MGLGKWVGGWGTKNGITVGSGKTKVSKISMKHVEAKMPECVVSENSNGLLEG